jgi:hypothetical protein
MRRALLALVFVWLACEVCAEPLHLTPEPKQVQVLPGQFVWGPGMPIALGSAQRDQFFAAQLDGEVRRCFGFRLPLGDPLRSPIRLGLLSDAVIQPALAGQDLSALKGQGTDAYLLLIVPQGITLAGKGTAGVFNALLTLDQLLRRATEDRALPCVRILDWPTPRPSRRAPSVLAPQPEPSRPPTPTPPADRKWTFTFSAQDHARFASVLAGLRAEGEQFMLHPAAGQGPSDFLRYTVLSKAPPGGRMQRNRNATITPSWSTGVTICKFATDAEAAQRWKASVICPSILDYRRDDLDARRQGLQDHGLGGSIQVTEDTIVDWSPYYLPWYYGSPIRNPDPRYKYWLQYGLQVLHLYKNCIISAGAGRVDQFQGGDKPTPDLLRADPNQLLAAAEALVDEKRGERPSAPAPTPAAPSTATTEPPESTEEVDVGYLDRRWLGSILDALSQAESRLTQTLALLATQRIAAAQLRARIQRLEQLLTVDDSTGDDPLDWFVTHWDAAWGQPPPVTPGQGVKDGLREEIAGLRQQLSGVLHEQDEDIAAIRDTYGSVLAELQALGSRCATASVRQAGEALQQQVVTRGELAELELTFASGQRERFRALAENYIGAGKYVPLARLMEGFDDLEHAQPRGALQAMRLCLQADPKNAVAAELTKRLEVGYLRALDANVLGEAAEVRDTCWNRLKQKGEEGFFGALLDVLSTGPANAINEAWNEESVARAEEAGTLQMDAATTHGGLLLIARLREQNLDLGQIRSLNNAQLISRVKELFGRDISPRDALRMRTAMIAAFRDPQVEQLVSGRGQLSTDTGQRSAASDAFDETWREWIGDCVNVKNIITLVGPSAVYTQGGKLAQFSLAAEGELMTAKDAFAGAIRLPKLASALSRSKYGQVCVQELLQFYETTGNLSYLLAEGIVQQGIVQAASAVGQLAAGDLGDRIAGLAGDLMTSFGVGDLELAVKLLRASGATAHQVRCVASRLHDMAGQLETPDSMIQQRARFEQALKRLEAGQQLSAADLKNLEDCAQILGQMKQALAEKAAGRPSMALAQRQQVVAALTDGVQQAHAGEVAGAQVTRSFVEACEDIERNGRKTCTQMAEECDQIARRLSQGAEAPAPAPAVRVAAVKGLNAPPAKSPLDATKGHDLLWNLDLVSPNGCTRIPDAHLRDGDFAKAARYYEGLAEHARNMKGADPGWQAHVTDYLTRRRDLAERTRVAQEAFRANTRAPNAGVTAKIEDTEMARLMAAPGLELKPMTGPATLTKPRWVTVGGQRVAVFKPLETGAASGKDEATVEAAFNAMGELLGIKVPASKPVTIKVDGVDTPGVFLRYVDGSELGDCTVGQVLAVKTQIARARVLRTFLGDYDLQARNIKVDASGVLFDMDHGQARILGPAMPADATPEELRAALLEHMEMCAKSNENSQALSNPLYQLVGAAENQVEYGEVRGIIEDLQARLRDGSLRSSLAPVFGGELDKVMKVLEIRAGLLEQVFKNNKFREVAPRVRMPVGGLPTGTSCTPGQPVRQLGWFLPEPVLTRAA